MAKRASRVLLLLFLCIHTFRSCSQSSEGNSSDDFPTQAELPQESKFSAATASSKSSGTVKAERDKHRRECLLELQEEYRQLVAPYIANKRPVLTGMVYHGNLGDSFIQAGEQVLFEELDYHVSQHCSPASCNMSSIEKHIEDHPADSIIVSAGGGNFGDLWYGDFQHRMEIVKRFPNTPLVVLPQSVYYRSMETAKKHADVFARHKNVKIFTRDLRSLTFLREYFSATPSQLAPDGAFMLGPLDPPDCSPEADVLVVSRGDSEKDLKFGNVTEELLQLDANGISYALHDWPCGIWWPWPDMIDEPAKYAPALTKIGQRCLCKGKLLITDRLHAMVLATLMGIPHIFLDNSYGKIHALRVSLFQPRPACSDENLQAHRAHSWRWAVSKAMTILRNT